MRLLGAAPASLGQVATCRMDSEGASDCPEQSAQGVLEDQLSAAPPGTEGSMGKMEKSMDYEPRFSPGFLWHHVSLGIVYVFMEK